MDVPIITWTTTTSSPTQQQTQSHHVMCSTIDSSNRMTEHKLMTVLAVL